MEKGVLDILTVIDPKLMPVKLACAVPYRCLGCLGLDNDLVARTNNRLERFHLVGTIRTISQDFVAEFTDVAQGRRKRGNNRNTKTRKRW
ncbi:hypothetical protein PHMEG_00013427 [Phytophthora megakarya]|uniref:Uncharacterized protein n=1 Tax=Phytophthora megakarya TaxID=4795 RepID=A0A225W7T7_9STRA|nr:hypothetical protein PHMEG_00013427 [Phytophthora megakarya]